jgi:phosphatidylglycerol:prolipoprotein diacylglycerol transferase
VHPILLQIPLPRVTVPLGLSLLLLALVGVMVAALGRHARARDFVAMGVAIAVASAVGSVALRGKETTLGPLPIYGFGVMLCAGLLGGWFLCLAHAERDGLSREASAATYFAAAVSGLVGARLLYVLTNLHDFGSVSEALAFRSGGLVFYGGVLGGLAGSVVYARRRRLEWVAWADAAAPSLALGSMLGRIGCYFAGCDYGLPLGPNASRFLVRLGTFPRWSDDVAGAGAGSPAWVDQVLYRGLPFDRATSMPVHPTQLYEAVTSCLVLVVLLALRARKQFRGQIFLAFVSLYGATRFVLELVRDDPERGLYGPAAAPRVLAALGFVAMAAAFVVGPARSFSRPEFRAMALVLAAAAPVVAYFALSPRTLPTSFSTSQWIAIASSLAVAFVWRKSMRGAGARTPPEHVRTAL